VRADDEVVAVSDSATWKSARELGRLLGCKAMEGEILKERPSWARQKTDFCCRTHLLGDIGEDAATTLGVARLNVTFSALPQAHDVKIQRRSGVIAALLSAAFLLARRS
jgi:hypothetical protein